MQLLMSMKQERDVIMGPVFDEDADGLADEEVYR